VEFHQVPKAARSRHYFQVGEQWNQDFEAPALIGVPSPWVVSYFTREAFLQRGESNRFRCLIETETLIFWVLAFVQACTEGVQFSRQNDNRCFRSYEGGWMPGRLTRIPPVLADRLSVEVFFNALEHTGTHAILARLAFLRSLEVSWIHPQSKTYRYGNPNGFLRYDFERGLVDGFPEGFTEAKNPATLAPISVHWRRNRWATYLEAEADFAQYITATAGRRQHLLTGRGIPTFPISVMSARAMISLRTSS